MFGGAQAAIGDRQAARQSLVGTQMTEQFQFALVDISFGRYEAAKQRLEFIISNDPNYPGASQKLTEVLVAMSVPTATSTPLPTPTPNPSGAEGVFAQAQQLIAAGDWGNALVAIDQIRKADPNYRAGEVDGMYYFTLRNYGYNQIIQQGNLEGGIYELTLAERFGPLDNTANGLREGARAYITAASFWEINWEQAVAYLSQVAGGWPSLWDGTMTASQRFYIASMRYGDELFKRGDFCDAVAQYQNASSIAELDAEAAKGLQPVLPGLLSRHWHAHSYRSHRHAGNARGNSRSAHRGTASHSHDGTSASAHCYHACPLIHATHPVLGAWDHLLAAHAGDRHLDRQPGRHFDPRPASRPPYAFAVRPAGLSGCHAKAARAGGLVQHGHPAGHRAFPVERQPAL